MGIEQKVIGVIAEWLQYYDELPDEESSAPVIQSWDFAPNDGNLNDFSVCTE